MGWPISYQLEETARTLVPLDNEVDAVLLHLVNTVIHIVIPVRDNRPEMSLNSFINLTYHSTQMKLTQLQKDCIKKLATADVRAEDTMLGLLLIEGIRFFYCDNEPINSINYGELNHNALKEMTDALVQEIQNNLN